MNKTNPSTSYFNNIADQWDSLRTGYFSENLRDLAIKKAYLHKDMQVVDVGAGTGFISTGVAPLVKKVHLIDASEKMLERAKNNLINFNNIEFHLADGLDLPINESSTDAVFANMYLHHCPDPFESIKQMVKILQPGGRLVITDLDTHTNTWMKSEMSDYWLGFDRKDIRKWFEEAGLVNVIVDCSGQNCTSDHNVAENQVADISIFIAIGTRKINAHEVVQEDYSAKVKSADCGCADSSCCSPSSLILQDFGKVNWNSNYSLEDKASLPNEVVEISFGCGNPIAMAGLQPGEIVLDIGSGGGIDVFLASKKVGPNGFVFGVDMTKAMLDRAREAAKKGNYENVEFKFGFAEQLPLKNEEVDVVISNCVINLSEDKGKVFYETYRVLKKNGRLEVNDTVFGGSVPPQIRTSDGWSECISGALPEEEYIDLVKQAGFKDIKVTRSTSNGRFYDVPFYSVQISAKKVE